MKAWCSLTQEFFALLCRVFDAELRHGLIIVAAHLQFRQQRPRQRRPTQRDEPLDLEGTENRKNTRDDWYRDASPRQEVAAFEIVAILEEQLGDDKIRSVSIFVLASPIRYLPSRMRRVPHEIRRANGYARTRDVPTPFV